MESLKLGARVRWSGSRRGGVARSHEGVIVALCAEGTDAWRSEHFALGGTEFSDFLIAVASYRDHRGNGRNQRVLVKVENEGSKPHYYAPRTSALEVLS